mmetsp:Transcript_25825/g.31725  ORF Transcript_25825/g.31725 Transcript_25825/m.31725 type:complete len:365 (-) Transcript_25825:47-1141(-)
MDIAIEKGFCAEKAKVGSGDKTPAYAIGRKVLKKFLLAVGVSFLILVVLGTVYFRMFLDEKARNQLLKKIKYQRDAQTIRLGVALQAALYNDDADEHVRSFQRINSYIEKQLDGVLLESLDGDVKSELTTAKANILKFVDGQLQNFIQENRDASNKKREKLDQIAAHQKDALNSLLEKISSVRLKALEEMLEDLFDALETEVKVGLSIKSVNKLDKIVDQLFDKDYEHEKALEQAMAVFRENGYVLPTSLEKIMVGAKNNAEMASILDEIAESARLSEGRSELEKIRDEFVAKKNALHGKGKNSNRIAQDLGKITIDAVVKVQELVNRGIVPVEYLDFADLDLDEYYDEVKDGEEHHSGRHIKL